MNRWDWKGPSHWNSFKKQEIMKRLWENFQLVESDWNDASSAILNSRIFYHSICVKDPENY